MVRLNWTCLWVNGALATLLALVSGMALAQTPTAAQMEAFKNLTPEQQQAILEQMGGSGQTGTVRRDRDVTAPETVRPRTTTPPPTTTKTQTRFPRMWVCRIPWRSCRANPGSARATPC